jgi:DNA-binding MarR family transcriptional regulator
MGLTPSQLTLLVVLERSGPTSPASVAQVLDLEKSTLSRNLGRALEAGWIRDRAQGGLKRLELTPSGRRLLGRAYVAWRRAQEEAGARLGPRAVDALLHLHT